MPYKKYKQYRLQGYDYAGIGDYFITICTKNRIHHFGKIKRTGDDAIMELTAIGSFIQECIFSIPGIYKNAEIGETVVMPNHIHLIVSLPFNEMINLNQLSTAPIRGRYKGLQPLVQNSIPSIVNHLKGKVKKWCNTNGYSDFAWQRRYHDHIIRDPKSFNRISNYIANNVSHWAEDENNESGNHFQKEIRM